jgi:hypothetical protein
MEDVYSDMKTLNYILVAVLLSMESYPAFTVLKVVGNEKGGGSRSRLLLEYGFGPWRSMSV